MVYLRCLINKDVGKVSLRQAHEGKSPGSAQRGHHNLVLSKLLYRGDAKLVPLNPGAEDKHVHYAIQNIIQGFFQLIAQ